MSTRGARSRSFCRYQSSSVVSTTSLFLNARASALLSDAPTPQCLSSVSVTLTFFTPSDAMCSTSSRTCPLSDLSSAMIQSIVGYLSLDTRLFSVSFAVLVLLCVVTMTATLLPVE